jgi:hypothetical protein
MSPFPLWRDTAKANEDVYATPSRANLIKWLRIQCFLPQNKVFPVFIFLFPFSSLESRKFSGFAEEGIREKIIRDCPFFQEYCGRVIGMYIGAAELVLINSLIVVLIMVDGIIRIGSER